MGYRKEKEADYATKLALYAIDFKQKQVFGPS